ncbi:hypothetical protein IMAU30132_01026 [Lactobacillus helveticus]|nr:hypothetical protein [Lactobacillus helveticus]NRO39056.1 hypothetical protein [Lactobacillus helveticus]NRO48665.1 hypothetical protein [Lactobacillus helveticus]NRO59127.1 hypothetical protein [Lactobacillus helveticus]
MNDNLIEEGVEIRNGLIIKSLSQFKKKIY